MSTRGVIAIRNEDGTYRGIWNQHDSYPECLGETLYKHYDTTEKVNALIDRGESSSIEDTLDESCFYADHGEDLQIDTYPSRENLIEKYDHDVFMEYLYLWENDRWYIYFVDDYERYIKGREPVEYGLIREKLISPEDEE